MKRMSGHRVTELRAKWARVILEKWQAGMPLECAAAVCVMPTRAIGPGSSWDLGHPVAIAEGGTVWNPAELRPEHSRCNRTDGANIANRRRSARGRRIRG